MILCKKQPCCGCFVRRTNLNEFLLPATNLLNSPKVPKRFLKKLRKNYTRIKTWRLIWSYYHV